MSCPMLSIIIPVYNKEKYLSDSLDSLLKQTFTDSEIIIVNDGSTDNSLNIIKEYQVKCSRIKIIDQKNAGASAARNRGIEAAQGKYVIMFDADDLIDKDMHQNMVRCAEQYSVDMVCCNYYITRGRSVVSMEFDYPCEQFLDRNYIESVVIPNALCKPGGSKFLNAHWTLLIKRNILIENNVRYNELHRKEEDKPFIMHTLKYTQSIAFVKERHYNYRRFDDSLLCQYSPRFNYLLRNFELYKKLFSDIFDFDSEDWIDYFVRTFEECIEFVIIHKKKVKNIKSEIMHIIACEESKANVLKAGDKYSAIRRLYQNDDINGIYRYYMKKFFKLRLKITIRGIVRG